MVLIKTNKELIYRLSTNGLLRTYCHFLHWKALYKNGTIYGNALSNLSRKTKRSRTCLKHHIDIMIYEGWVTVRDNNLCFHSHKRIRGIYSCSQKRDTNINFDGTLNCLRLQVMSYLNDIQRFVVGIKSDLVAPKNKSVRGKEKTALQIYKRAKRFAKKYGLYCKGEKVSIRHGFRISLFSLSKAFGVKSLSGASFIVNQLDIKVIRKRHPFQQWETPQKSGSYGYFYSKGLWYKQGINEYQLTL